MLKIFVLLKIIFSSQNSKFKRAENIIVGTDYSLTSQLIRQVL